MEQTSAWYGPMLIACGFIPLFIGWRLIRVTTALVVAGLTLGAALALCHGRVDGPIALVAAVSAAIISGFAGWFAYQFFMMIATAAVLMSLTVQAVTHAWPHALIVAVVAGAVSALVGAVLGWRMAPYIAIIDTVLVGFAQIALGMIITAQVHDPRQQTVMTVIVALITIPVGIWVQTRAQRRSTNTNS